MLMRQAIAMTAALLILGLAGNARAAPADCATEVAVLVKDEAELPRLDVASPKDRPVLCITIETVIDFASRLRAHVAHCPGSSYVSAAADWEKTRVDYAKRFAQNHCRRTIF
jgi:hypothetical protein